MEPKSKWLFCFISTPDLETYFQRSPTLTERVCLLALVIKLDLFDPLNVTTYYGLSYKSKTHPQMLN